MQAIAGLQRSPVDAAQTADNGRGAAPEHERHVDAAVQRNVDARPVAALTKPEHAPRSARTHRVGGERGAVDRCAKIGARNRHARRLLDSQFGAEQRGFERRGAGRVAHERVRKAIRAAVHRAGDRHAAILLAPAPRILDGREEAGIEDGY